MTGKIPTPIQIARQTLDGLVEEHELRWWRGNSITLAVEVLKLNGIDPESEETAPDNPVSEFERGARAAIEAFDLYFRNENGGIVAGVHYESDDSGPEFWKPITEDELEGYGKSALADVMYDERVTKCAACGQAIESHNAPGASFYSHILHPADDHEAAPTGEDPSDDAATKALDPEPCAFDGGAHHWKQNWIPEKQEYITDCRKCGHEQDESKYPHRTGGEG